MSVIRNAMYRGIAQDENGNVIPNASVTVTNENGGGLAVLYDGRAVDTIADNPLTADSNGYFEFYTVGGAYRIDVTKDLYTRTHRWVGIGTASEFDASDLLFSFPMFWQASNKPGLGEELPPVDVPYPLTLYTTFQGWYGRVRVAPTLTQEISIVTRAGASGASTEIATLTIDAGEYEGAFAMADDVSLDIGAQVWPVMPNPRDATMADFSMVITARR